MKKLHWTQTPEGKKRALAILARGREQKKNQSPQNGSKPRARKEDPTQEQFIYAYGRIQGWIQAFSESVGCSPAALAAWVGSALYPDPSRGVRGTQGPVRNL